MDKSSLLIGVLLAVGIVTVIIGKVLGPMLLKWLSPSFNRVTNRIDDALAGQPESWERQVRGLVEKSPEKLREQVEEVLSQYGVQKRLVPDDTLESLPTSVRAFFEQYSSLSFDGITRIIDEQRLREIFHKGKNYVVFGDSEDSDRVYAISPDQHDSVVSLVLKNDGSVFSVEEDAPSFEHFVLLQHALHTKAN